MDKALSITSFTYVICLLCYKGKRAEKHFQSGNLKDVRQSLRAILVAKYKY